MADKTYPQLTSAASATSTDLVAVYITADTLLKKMTFATFVAQIVANLGGSVLTVANNLSDVASIATARLNLGLGSAALLASNAVFQVANNLSEIANAATARTNIGAAASDAATLTSGVTQSGSTKQNVQALAGLDIDLSLTDFFTKSISANSTFTFSNPTSTKAQAFILELTTSSNAQPTWPASVTWANGVKPPLPNGRHVLGFVTTSGGSVWTAMIGAQAAA